MKKLFLSIVVAIFSFVSAFAGNEATFVGDQAKALEIRGSSWLEDYTSIGWSIGSYSDAPGQRYNYIMLYNYSSANIQIQPGSKLILKVNGQPMVLTTSQGTYYEGSTVLAHQKFDRFLGWINYYGTTVFYEVSQEQADAINTYGISKYRYQIDQTVFERDNMNEKKIAKKMKAVYDKLSVRNDKKVKKVDDLSDF